jgi:4-amino-4-deoxy-L-arabinose transferase-like glycosyltransferase
MDEAQRPLYLLMSDAAASMSTSRNPFWRRPIEAWFDGIEAGWAVPVFLVGFVAAWMAYLQLAYLSGDLHPDVVEAWSLGRSLAWGSIKHPPLTGWIARAWTTVFPVQDWSFHLLAMTNAAIALWLVDRITRRFAGGDKRGIVLLLLLLLPVYQIQAQRFNANSVLFAVWPLAVFCFLRSFETRHPGWAIAAGITGALAILGKYYSGFLIAGFVVAAISHPLRKAYFTSSAPWISACVGLALLAPHIHWMVTSGISPLDYALAAHGGVSVWGAVQSGCSFLLGVAATLALPLAIWGVMIRSKLRGYLADLRTMDSGLLLLLLIAVATIVLPPVVAVTLKSSLTVTWAAQGFFLFIVVAVCSAKCPVDRIEADKLAALVLAITAVALLVAPVHAFYRNGHPFNEGRNYYRLASQELTRHWREVSTAPLADVSGDKLAMAMSFYGEDHPAFIIPYNLRYEWQMPSQAVLEQGWATMCFQDETTCLVWSKQLAGLATGAVVFDFTVQPQLWGHPGVPARISAVLVPPKR